ncbi:2-succinyl-5-enolpyruvyl-6-hydroxy-3-cyclohexene-1-carboxylic-acid synthase [Sinomicrobium weinanense]|uniref:2-succinyl-5-enolpyruvyl-6-hydroxy-3-cyclohexene-1-carboxylate synthase n=1 Tax=Sinomicrobium weinanense TaxID=2842200 RepID=A0A926JUK8_9FLAO|nr:2-succinyl-5-enolpyruvyl-6-hydroxy-3-cyclohexene-1-carboxylic-acid synthase [Sinomicrobium weinanense]MBC9797523.1 2-succinyl-5-enolpyruvyl-6-hydroxy-3-cyclohexene-1-carboxylic-acid synthase [Sinomicrobium weinanense]MBU3122382.1 2-succinyl-5-enolpyruvyl-6-hydroxy-3-cyclohexene-1-carboxylic-acid synthase [Sinomicrobium weinanense]
MIYPKIPLAQTVLQLCRAKNITEVVISPGSRNAPLTIGFTHDEFFNCYSIIDERCAAFFAMGMAQWTRRPAALVCTSGSALLNYYPAVCEAFYSDIPLVVISADRPADKIDIGDGQTIRQQNVFANHILYSANLREGDKAYNEEQVQKAIHTAVTGKGPVHINVPFEEPLYEVVETPEAPAVIWESKPEKKEADKDSMDTFVKRWNQARRKMVLVGVNHPGDIPGKYLDMLADDPSVIVFTETTSNLFHSKFFPGIDKIVAPVEKIEEELQKLQPELLLTFGGMIVSKKIKAFLRKYTPEWHYHIDTKKAYDTFFGLTHHFLSSPAHFFSEVAPGLEKGESDYQSYWQDARVRREEKHDSYLKTIPFSDFKVYDRVFRAIPEEQLVHFSNSATIRYSQLFAMRPGWQVYCNRGTSGIDGSTSTAIGASVAGKVPATFITGDLSFFYDSNALWNKHIRKDFRIILINNGGGGIFRILPGHKNTPNFDTYFETIHGLTAEHLCKMYGIDYVTADDENSLKDRLTGFYAASDRPKLLEVFTPRTINDGVLIDYFKHLTDDFSE